MARVGAGWETEIYSFDIEYWLAAQVRRKGLVVRLYPGDGASAKAAHEFRGMRQLYDSGYPVPRVLALEGDGSPLGRPFILMERIDGEILWPLLMNSTGGHQQQLLTLFCELFVRLHGWIGAPSSLTRRAATGTGQPTPLWMAGWAKRAALPLPTFLCPDLIVLWTGCRSDGICCPAPSRRLCTGTFTPSTSCCAVTARRRSLMGWAPGHRRALRSGLDAAPDERLCRCWVARSYPARVRAVRPSQGRPDRDVRSPCLRPAAVRCDRLSVGGRRAVGDAP